MRARVDCVAGGGRWSPAEEDLIRKHNDSMTQQELAALLGRSAKAVEHRRARLGLKSNASVVRRAQSASMWGRKNPNWRERPQPAAGHIRAQRRFPDCKPCEVCGSEKTERHHRDGDTFNNTPENIAFLCRRHHMQVDGRSAQARSRRFGGRKGAGPDADAP